MSKRHEKRMARIRRDDEEALFKKSLEMVRLWAQGHRILAAGFVFSPTHDFTMSLTDAAKARDLLAKKGILMRRIDSGGSPEWEFKLSSQARKALQ